MKFFAYAMLIGVASSIVLNKLPATNELIQSKTLAKGVRKGEFINMLAKFADRLKDSKKTYLNKDDVFQIFAPE